ncbi:hypothetical protein FQA39_LY03532 [Lamprigera yunnana]|nr:hypothetical protein FQA39_LY03532 [Lamprigera yunnana]
MSKLRLLLSDYCVVVLHLRQKKTTTAILQAVFSSNVAVECNWEGRGDKQGIKDFPVVKLMQSVLQGIPAFKDVSSRTFVAVAMNWLRNSKARHKAIMAKMAPN